MTVNPYVDSCTKILNHQQILRNRKKKLLKTKRILKLKYKPSGGQSFPFTVTVRRGNSPLQQQQIDPNTVRISTDYLRGVEKILEIPSSDKKFSGVPSENISFTATFYWDSINSSWILAASTPVVPELHSATFISECSEWWVVVYKYKRRCLAELLYL